jgi:2-succinyl-6-hydroxy-2,4-cyclohexadiene-1-carboxylate synthase
MLAFKQLTDGPGTPLVFLHGMLGSWLDWLPVCAELKDRLCIAVDLPGHGDSPFTERFNEELLNIAPPRFHLIGYSMGGRLAMGFAAAYPEKIASLTLISAHFGIPEEERPARLKRDEAWAKMLLERPIDEFLTQWYEQPVFHTLDKERMRNMRQKQDAPSVAKCFIHYSLGRQPIYEPKGNILVGEWDPKFIDLYRNHNPIVIPKAGHAAHLEQPQTVARVLQEITNSQ